jgi:sec-independent protein translocase protein TatA
MLNATPMIESMPGFLAVFGLPGGGEWIILLVLGLLIFGRRLPEVGRSLGRGIVEFKRGIRGVEDDVDEEVARPTKSRKSLADDRDDRGEALPSQFASETARRERDVVKPDEA